MSVDKKTREQQDPYSKLVERCKKQDRRAQRDLYEKLSARMFPVCLRYIGDREMAKDVLHDGFITLFSKLGDYRGEGTFEGWARRIFVTACLMQLRMGRCNKRQPTQRGSKTICGIRFAQCGKLF